MNGVIDCQIYAYPWVHHAFSTYIASVAQVYMLNVGIRGEEKETKKSFPVIKSQHCVKFCLVALSS
jgi:hypothetical protein